MAKQQFNRIAERRKLKGWSQQQLADAVGVHWVTISKLERGVTRLHIGWLERLSEALDVNPTDLLVIDQGSRNIAISGRVHIGGEIEAVEINEDLTFSLDLAILYDPWVQWVKVVKSALYPYFKDGDMLAVQWVELKELEDKDGNINFFNFSGRFCLIEDADGAQWMGVLSAGSRVNTVTLHNANYPPLVDIVPTGLAPVIMALMEPPAMPPQRTKQENSD